MIIISNLYFSKVKISKDDFKDWHPTIEMAGTSYEIDSLVQNRVRLVAKLDFDKQEITYIVTGRENEKDFYEEYPLLCSAIKSYNGRLGL